MNLLRNIKDNSIIKIELVSVLSDQSIVFAPVEGNFSQNNTGVATFDQIYFTADSCYLEETGKETAAGYPYLQEFGFKIPTNKNRVTFLNYFKILKLIRFHHCDGTFVDIGRNDYEQNTPMVGSFETISTFTSIKWSVQTIFPYDYNQ